MPTRPKINIAGYHHIINRGVQIEWGFNGRGVSFYAYDDFLEFGKRVGLSKKMVETDIPHP